MIRLALLVLMALGAACNRTPIFVVPKELTQGGGDSSLEGTGETYEIEADMVFKAIGQQFLPATLDGSSKLIALSGGRIEVDAGRRTSLVDVWAGGDCVDGGEDLTVVAVEDGKIAAHSIDRYLGGADEAATRNEKPIERQR